MSRRENQVLANFRTWGERALHREDPDLDAWHEKVLPLPPIELRREVPIEDSDAVHPLLKAGVQYALTFARTWQAERFDGEARKRYELLVSRFAYGGQIANLSSLRHELEDELVRLAGVVRLNAWRLRRALLIHVGEGVSSELQQIDLQLPLLQAIGNVTLEEERDRALDDEAWFLRLARLERGADPEWFRNLPRFAVRQNEAFFHRAVALLERLQFVEHVLRALRIDEELPVTPPPPIFEGLPSWVGYDPEKGKLVWLRSNKSEFGRMLVAIQQIAKREELELDRIVVVRKALALFSLPGDWEEGHVLDGFKAGQRTGYDEEIEQVATFCWQKVGRWMGAKVLGERQGK